MKIPQKLAFFFLLTILLALPVHSNTILLSNNGISMELTLTDVYYTDYEGDGLENDIITDYNLTVTVSKNLNKDYSYVLHTELTLPSGMYFDYEFLNFIDEEVEDETMKFFIRIIFWDHALESGWYELTTGLELYQWGHVYGEMTTVFDPPTDGTGDAPPPPTISSSTE